MRQALYRGRVVSRIRRFPEEYHDFGWKYGDLHHYYNGSFFTHITEIVADEMETITHDVVAHSVSEWTGLLIGNQKLFEGDIFQYQEHKGYLLPSFTAHVVWIEESACFGYQRHDVCDLSQATPFSEHDELQTDFLNYCKIVGNFYDNNDLIPKVKIESPKRLPF